MAHDFVIILLDDEEETEAQAAFFGYAEAVFYRAFGAESFNAGVSGNEVTRLGIPFRPEHPYETHARLLLL